MRWMLIGLIGLAGGLVSGLFGVGGGVLFVPLMVIFLGMDLHLAIGTSLVAIVPIALVGACRHWISGMTDFRIAWMLVGWAVIGSWIGASISINVDVAALRKVYAVFLFVVAARLFFWR